MGKDLVEKPGSSKPFGISAIAAKYIRYYLTSANGKGHGSHSPFVFHFITHLLNDRQVYPEYGLVENIRKTMLADNRTVSVVDLGAGAASSSSRKISAIARNAVKPRKYGQLLFRMTRAWKPGTIIELGTSLGITTSYLFLANPAAKMLSIEGAPEIAAIAKQNLHQAGIENAEIRVGNFDEILPGILASLACVDLVFIDGNHLEEPTLRYFNMVLSKVHNDSVVIFDDIHWSAEMETAWEKVKKNPAVRCSIDLFFIGIVFFRREFMEKQHFTIRF